MAISTEQYNVLQCILFFKQDDFRAWWTYKAENGAGDFKGGKSVSQDSCHFMCSNLAPYNDHLRLTRVLSVKHRGAEEFSQKPKVMAIKTILWILSGETLLIDYTPVCALRRKIWVCSLCIMVQWYFFWLPVNLHIPFICPTQNPWSEQKVATLGRDFWPSGIKAMTWRAYRMGR